MLLTHAWANMAVTEVNALTATEGQERKVVPSRNARRPRPEVPQSKSSTWRSFAPRSAEDEERKVVPSAGIHRFCMVSGKYMEVAKILRVGLIIHLYGIVTGFAFFSDMR